MRINKINKLIVYLVFLFLNLNIMASDWPSHQGMMKPNEISWTNLDKIEWRVALPVGGFPNRNHNTVKITKISGNGSGQYSHAVVEYKIIDGHRYYRNINEYIYSAKNTLIQKKSPGKWIDTGSSSNLRSMDPMYDFITTSIIAYDYSKLTYEEFKSNAILTEGITNYLLAIKSANAIKHAKEKENVNQLNLQDLKKDFETFIDFRNPPKKLDLAMDEVIKNGLEENLFSHYRKKATVLKIYNTYRCELINYGLKKSLITLIKIMFDDDDLKQPGQSMLAIYGYDSNYNKAGTFIKIPACNNFTIHDLDNDENEEVILINENNEKGNIKAVASIASIKDGKLKILSENVASLIDNSIMGNGIIASAGLYRINQNSKLEFIEIKYQKKNNETDWVQVGITKPKLSK